jgi:hypothetical protein
MTGKQLIVLGLLLSGTYIYVSYQHISRELSKEYNISTPIAIVNIKEKSNTKITTETIEEINSKVETVTPPPINIEKKVIEVIEVIQAKKIVPLKEEESHTEEQIIEKLIEKKPKDNLESEIEAALKGISTSQAIGK